MTPATGTHIQLDERGVAWIDDTNVKVVEVAVEALAHGASPQAIHDQHQGNLSLAQIHAALAWYYDHQAEMDAEIRLQVEEFDRLRAQTLDSPGRQRLRAQGKLP
jgi:uncharacterized protein (DUF433 family)